jgi:hypothetical protein
MSDRSGVGLVGLAVLETPPGRHPADGPDHHHRRPRPRTCGGYGAAARSARVGRGRGFLSSIPPGPSDYRVTARPDFALRCLPGDHQAGPIARMDWIGPGPSRARCPASSPDRRPVQPESDPYRLGLENLAQTRPPCEIGSRPSTASPPRQPGHSRHRWPACSAIGAENNATANLDSRSGNRVEVSCGRDGHHWRKPEPDGRSPDHDRRHRQIRARFSRNSSAR